MGWMRWGVRMARLPSELQHPDAIAANRDFSSTLTERAGAMSALDNALKLDANLLAGFKGMGMATGQGHQFQGLQAVANLTDPNKDKNTGIG